MNIGYFTYYTTTYRKRLFELINNEKNISMDVYASFDYPGNFPFLQSGDYNFNYNNNPIWKIKLPFVGSIFFMPFALKQFIKKKYDVYLFTIKMSDISFWLMLILGKIFNRKICVWGHIKYKYESRYRIFLKKIIIKFSIAIIFYDDSIRNDWVNAGIDSKKLFVAPNGLDNEYANLILNKISKEDITKFKINKKLHNSSNIIFIGRLVQRKKLDILIKSIEIVKREIPNIKLLIIGDGVCRNELEKLTEELELEKNILFIGELYDENIIAKYFFSSLFSIIPNAAGLSIHHSLQYSIPVIVGDNMKSHGPEIFLIKGKKTGLFFKNNNFKDLAYKIILLIKNNELRRKCSNNARKIIKDKYNIVNMSKGMIKAFYYAKTH